MRKRGIFVGRKFSLGTFVKVLINRSDAMGDALLSLPLCLYLKKEHKVHLTFLGSQRNREIFDIFPGLANEVWAIEEGNIKEKIKALRPDLYLYLGGTHVPSYYCWRLPVPRRGGIVSRWASFVFLNRGSRQRRGLRPLEHEVKRNFQLLDNVGLGPGDESAWGHYRPDPASQILRALKAPRPSVGTLVVHPGSSGHTLNWPWEHYKEVIKQVHGALGEKVQFVVSYTPQDRKGLGGFSLEGLPSSCPVSFLDGSQKGLAHYALCLAQARAFIGPSTGPTHLAGLLGVPTVGIYSPIAAQSALRWRPYPPTEGHIFTPSVECKAYRRCRGKRCPDYFCMPNLRPKDVAKRVIEILAPGPHPDTPGERPRWEKKTPAPGPTSPEDPPGP